MIPVRLFVRNFMCYRGEGETLDLETIHLACLAGENGAGKSALLSAITWALWGKARERISDDDQVMSLGATDMEVHFEFALGDARYLVIRKRQKRGSKSYPILELHMRTDTDSDTWRPLTGHSVPDTENRITKLLKMDYETFINSSFILQGRADSFTIKSPAERKEVLGKILGLEQYDRLEDRAKEEARERKALMAEIEATSRRIEADLEMRETYETQLEQVVGSLSLKQLEASALEAEIRALQMQVDAMKAVEGRLKELEARMKRREEQIDTTQARVYSKAAEKVRLEGLIARRDEIESGYARLQATRSEVEEHQDRFARQAALDREIASTQSLVVQVKVRLESQVANTEREIARYERDLAGRHEIERQLSQVLVDVEHLERLAVQHEDDKCTLETLKVRMRTLTQQKDSCEKEGKALRKKLDLILEAHAEKQGDEGCPLCGTPLGVDALQRVQDSYERDIAARRQEFEAMRKELDTINSDIVALELRISKQRDQLKDQPDLQKREARYTQALEQLNKEQDLLAEARTALAGLQAQVASGDYAHEERKQLAVFQARIRDLAYDKEAHVSTKSLLSELEGMGHESRYHELQGAGRQLPAVLADLESDTASLETWRREQEADRAEREGLSPQTNQLGEVEGMLADKRFADVELDTEIQELVGRRGDLKGKIENCEKLKAEAEDLQRQHKAAEDEKRIYDDLASAFGKKGIQAMIIENVIPEIEEEANSLLSRMTDGRMNVQFITQRDAKTTKSVIETLEINISDEMGTRPYEMYSGGEAYRVNFAVRIALSKLLARRAGAQLQLLVIDEGFGTQDGQGREKLIAAIRSIQDDFEKILVVTHIEELKSEFPVRIEVEKKDNGSRITVN